MRRLALDVGGRWWGDAVHVCFTRALSRGAITGTDEEGDAIVRPGVVKWLKGAWRAFLVLSLSLCAETWCGDFVWVEACQIVPLLSAVS